MKGTTLLNGLLLGAAFLSLSNPAFSKTYEFQFLANPDADSGSAPNGLLDVAYLVRFDSEKFQSYDLQTLSVSSHWIARDITLSMLFNGLSIQLNDALDPATPFVSIMKNPISVGGSLYEGGLVELYAQKSEFLDIDFHPWSSFILNNNLPFDPFVYGQLDVYDDQTPFSDFMGERRYIYAFKI